MKARMSRFAAVGLLGVALAALAPLAAQSAENYPNRPIRVLVGYAAGGVNDLVARAIAPGLSARLGQQVVVENRPGAGGNIATELAARARLEARDAARVLLRLSRVGLLEEHAAGAHPEGPVLIADPEFSALRGAVEHMLTRRAHPVALREVSLDEDVCAAIADAKPRLVVINASLLPEQAFKVAEARRSSAAGQELTMVAIVDGPQKELVQQLVSVGFDSILVKPMLASELEKVLVA